MALRLLLISFLLLPSAALCGGSGNFKLSMPADALYPASGAALNLMAVYFTRNAKSPGAGPEGFCAWPEFNFSKPGENAGTILTAAGVLSLPFLLDNFDFPQTATVAVMYLETAMLAWGTKDLLKGLFPKFRPYVSFDDTPEELLKEKDHFFSFPSGHSTIAFATASFSTFIFSKSEASTLSKVLFSVCNFGLASGVGVLRIVSGNHYFVDVLSGAAIGSVYGVLIPLSHQNKSVTPQFDGKSLGLRVEF
ncbi:MAG: phosphatase PAP2 family protein [Fibrobacter sp.]|nr:phosphatase PAP2 family protein [Fibrobacter sp.]